MTATDLLLASLQEAKQRNAAARLLRLLAEQATRPARSILAVERHDDESRLNVDNEGDRE